MEHIAIIDMGSNSIRFVIAQIKDNKAYSFVYQDKETFVWVRAYHVQVLLRKKAWLRL